MWGNAPEPASGMDHASGGGGAHRLDGAVGRHRAAPSGAPGPGDAPRQRVLAHNEIPLSRLQALPLNYGKPRSITTHIAQPALTPRCPRQVRTWMAEAIHVLQTCAMGRGKWLTVLARHPKLERR